MEDQIDLSVVMCTYNRAEMLSAALESVLDQETGGVSHEVILVDNNSTDNTRQVVERMIAERQAAGGGRLRYLFEARQGLSHARNAGIKVARGAIIAFTDDDVRANKDWVQQLKRTFDEHPEVDFAGGKVLPIWEREPPDWLTKEHWAPLALTDYGDEEFYVNDQRPICLVGANMAFRRQVFDLGDFAPKFQRVKNGIGSTEDHEFQIRLRQAGKQGLYSPAAVMAAEVQSERHHKDYHRRWHAGHGLFTSLMRVEDMERSGAGRLFDIPAPLYRLALACAAKWLRSLVGGRRDEAFLHELELRFFGGFIAQRRRDYFANENHRSSAREVGQFCRTLLGRKLARGSAPEKID